jgi:hypothetical protein
MCDHYAVEADHETFLERKVVSEKGKVLSRGEQTAYAEHDRGGRHRIFISIWSSGFEVASRPNPQSLSNLCKNHHGLVANAAFYAGEVV